VCSSELVNCENSDRFVVVSSTTCKWSINSSDINDSETHI
jgi:hypothetical protein